MHAKSKGTFGHKTKVIGKRKEDHLLLKLVCPAKQEKK